MKLSHYISLFAIFVSCSLSNNFSSSKNKNECIQALKKELTINWKLSSDSSFYQTNSLFESKLDSAYGKCLLKLDVKEITELFGKASETHQILPIYKYHWSMNYLISPPCPADARNSECRYFVVYFDSTMHVAYSTRLYFSGLTSE